MKHLKYKLGIKMPSRKLLLIMATFLVIITSQANSKNQGTNSYELDYADKKLNKYYKKIMNKLDTTDRIKLRESQRQWIIFRNLDCQWAFPSKPLDCLIERTNNRLKELKETLFRDTKGNYSEIE